MKKLIIITALSCLFACEVNEKRRVQMHTEREAEEVWANQGLEANCRSVVQDVPISYEGPHEYVVTVRCETDQSETSKAGFLATYQNGETIMENLYVKIFQDGRLVIDK